MFRSQRKYDARIMMGPRTPEWVITRGQKTHRSPWHCAQDAPAPRSRRDDPRRPNGHKTSPVRWRRRPLRPVAGVGDFAGGGRWPWGNLPGPRAWPGPGPVCGCSCDRHRDCKRSRVARRRAPRAPEPLVFAVTSRHPPPYPLLR